LLNFPKGRSCCWNK